MNRPTAYLAGAAALALTIAWIEGPQDHRAHAPVAASQPGAAHTQVRLQAQTAPRSYAHPRAVTPIDPADTSPGTRGQHAAPPAPAGQGTGSGLTFQDSPQGMAPSRADRQPRPPAATVTLPGAPAASSAPNTRARGQAEKDLTAALGQWQDHTTVRSNNGHIDINIVGDTTSSTGTSTTGSTATQNPYLPTAAPEAPVAMSVTASHGKVDCTLYRGGNSFTRLRLAMMGCQL